MRSIPDSYIMLSGDKENSVKKTNNYFASEFIEYFPGSLNTSISEIMINKII